MESSTVTKDLSYTELAARKRAELNKAIDEGKVQDPITLLVAVGVAVGSALIARAFAPKAPTQQVGLMKGTIQVQNSQQGIFIPEIYGAAPNVTLVPGTAANWVSNVNQSLGANGKATKNAGADQVWNGGAVHGTPVGQDDDAFIRFTLSGSDVPSNTFAAVAVGFSTDDSPESGLGVGLAPALEFGVIVGTNATGSDAASNVVVSRGFRSVINGIGGAGLGVWYDGDEFRIEKRAGVYRLYYGFAEVTAFTPPTPSATVYISVSTWRTGYGITTAYVQVGGDIGTPPSAGSGGCKVPAMIVWGLEPKKHSTTTQQPSRGGKGRQSSTPVESIHYTMSFRANFARGAGGLELVREYGNTDVLLNNDPNMGQPTNIYNPPSGGAPGPIRVNPIEPPDPIPLDVGMALLADGDPVIDGDGVQAGSIQQGASQVAVYPGNSTQGVDPTEEAAVDAKHGPGSTTAHRGIAGIVHTELNLQRWQNLMPNITAVWQHATLKTLGAIYAYLCTRIVDQHGTPLLGAGDYDFSSIDSIKVRGMLLDGRRFSPQEVMDNPDLQDVYNYFTTEGDGLILAYENGEEPSVTIPESKVGWLDGGAKIPDIFTPITPTMAEETKFPRQVDLRYIDPGTDWEPNTQSSFRRVTLGNSQVQLQVQVTLNADEASTATDRRIYREYVAGTTLKFTLTWEYLYIYAGYKIIIPTSAGLTYTVRLTNITGGVGLRDCEAICLEPAAFSQAGVGGGPPSYNPAQPMPALTVLSFMDIPAYKESDRGRIGFHAAGTPRETDLQTWNGFALVLEKGDDEWETIAEFGTAAIMGRIVSVTGTLQTDPNVTDNTSVITVDLYGSKATLESVDTADMINGLNRAVLAGVMIVGFATAVRVAGYQNRWQLSVLRNGQNSTEDRISGVFTNKSFTFLNEAVQFIELEEKYLDQTLVLRAVSFGQSISDAPESEAVYSGHSAKASTPTVFNGMFDTGSGSLLFEWVEQTLAPTRGAEEFELEIRSGAGAGASTIRGPMPISPLQLARNTIHPPLEEHTGSGVMFGCGRSTVHSTFWQDPSGAIIDFPNYCATNGGFEIRSKNDIDPTGGFLFEVEIGDNYLPLRVGIAEWNGYFVIGPTSPVFWWQSAGTIVDSSPSGMYVVAMDNDGILTHTEIKALKGERISIVVSPDGTVSFYLNYLGASSQPVAIAHRKVVDFSKKYRIFFSECSRSPQPAWPGSFKRFEFRKTRLLRQTPEFVYTGDMQRDDNSGSLPATVYARMRQKSLHPLGEPSPWIYGTFVR